MVYERSARMSRGSAGGTRSAISTARVAPWSLELQQARIAEAQHTALTSGPAPGSPERSDAFTLYTIQTIKCQPLAHLSRSL